MTRWTLLAFSFLLIPEAAGAASYFLSGPADTVRVVDQSAIVVFADGWEELSLAARAVGPRKSFVWLIPVPGAPRVLSMSGKAFEALSATGNPGLVQRARTSSGCPAPVTRLDQPVGLPYRRVDYLASEEDLKSWARQLGLHLPAEVTEDPAGSGQFVALQYSALPWRPDSAFPDTVAVGPVRIRFATEAPFFPVGVAAAADSGPEVRIYLLATSYLVPDEDIPDWSIDLRDSVSLSGTRFLPGGAFIPGSVQLPGVADPDSHFVHVSNPPRLLTRATAILPAGPHSDIRFRPYDPIAELQRPEAERRAVAATMIGRERTPGGLGALRAFLSRSPAPGEDVYSAIWAVGQLGDASSGPVLEPWSRHEDPDCRLEAMAAFGACGAPEGQKSCLDLLTRPAETEGITDGNLGMTMERSALRFLSEYGDSKAAAVLQESADRNGGREAWLEGWNRDEDYTRYRLGVNAVTALAGMGDQEAVRTMLRGVRGQAALSADSALVAEAQAQSGHDRFSWTNLWLFAGIRAPYGIGKWSRLGTFLWATQALPRLQEALLDSLLSGPGIPDAGRVLLIACLPERTEADFDSLEAIWHRALRNPRSETTLEMFSIGDTYRPVRINLTALAVVHCLARLQRVDRLARLLPEVAGTDSQLASEIAMTLSTLGDEAGLAYCEDVVKNDWPRLAGAEAYRDLVRGNVESPELRIWNLLGTFDDPWPPRFASALKSGRGRDYWRERMADRGTPALLRLMWISIAFDKADIHEARGMLRRLRAEGLSDPLITAVCRRIQEQFAEVEAWNESMGL